ncbi:GNAT family N-acetyltransferase [Nocardiopsis sp. RSe5-2]|uniref:GNAT family N-acetyltransferase n=1 Tax=Nocardiopsis endophytica TaxID=3018445 RepID=A0ABT4UCC4_9ACTN|nr:GNAT family N-acetyltransferase [Nocardiopsis endophytica]MDA2814634.1 GNAT family N-acetyltransferase [Nocardiopsis endophytica]
MTPQHDPSTPAQGDSSQRFVRAARAEDVDDIVRIQVAAWRAAYGPRLSAEVLAELTGEEAGRRFREQWASAIGAPPTSRHRLLVATDTEEPRGGAPEPGRVRRITVGFAALGPGQDPDLWPATDAELYALHVDPAHAGTGHGSRLLNAAVDHLVDDGFRTVHLWVAEEGDPLRAFVERSGWRPDGARREVDAGGLLPMVRLHAAIAADTPPSAPPA